MRLMHFSKNHKGFSLIVAYRGLKAIFRILLSYLIVINRNYLKNN